LGAIYKEHDLVPWFLSAEAMIHPASIGLSLLHSFGYGLPVITNNNRAKHGPEFCALEDNKNGITYIENDLDDLIEKVELLLKNNEYAEQLSENVKFTAEFKFNRDIMV